MNTCPVCGYNQLRVPPQDHTICPCCGTEFGYDDFATSHLELMREWVSNGMVWFSDYTLAPHGWSPVKQLRNTTHSLSPDDLEAIKGNARVSMGALRFRTRTKMDYAALTTDSTSSSVVFISGFQKLVGKIISSKPLELIPG